MFLLINIYLKGACYNKIRNFHMRVFQCHAPKYRRSIPKAIFVLLVPLKVV